MTPSSWDTWANRYRSLGHEVIVPGWPGIGDRTPQEVRRDPKPLEGRTITEIVDYYDGVIRALPQPPIIMGHSFGGIFTQMLLDRGLGRAGVGVEPRSARRCARAAVVHAAHRAAHPREPVPHQQGEQVLETALPLHVRQRPHPRRVRRRVGGERRQLGQPGVLRGSPLAAEGEDGHHQSRLPQARPRAAAAHLGRHRPRRAPGDPEGGPAEVPDRNLAGRARGVPRPQPPHRQSDRLGGSRRLRPELGSHAQLGRVAAGGVRAVER
ncbi:alpha/beta fold hydrolase [Microbacterium ureisolvens]|uniref:alpha/beta fold hydrolase n=1 Tax=Microbacterium ureisolvens TaxID=2781186 RepID=UPI003BB7E253